MRCINELILPLIMLIILIILLFTLPSFLINKYNHFVNGSETESITVKNSNIHSFEMKREKEKFLFFVFNYDYIYLFFDDGTIEVIKNVENVKLKKGNDNTYTVIENVYVKSEIVESKDLIIELDDDNFTEFNRQYAITFNRTPELMDDEILINYDAVVENH